jgi:phage baseplate assembly protein W
MSPHWRSWRFNVPTYDAPPEEPDTPPEELVGLVIDPAGGIATVADDDAIRQSLMLLISTRPGERVMRPEYGCDLSRLVFSPIDDTTAGLAIHFVRQAVERWEPRVEVLRVDAHPVDPSLDLEDEPRPEEETPLEKAMRLEIGTRLEILLDYRVRATRRTDSVVVGINLQEGP